MSSSAWKGSRMAEPHPQFSAFLDEILQDDEVREAFEAAQADDEARG